jgi:hypothetical protein
MKAFDAAELAKVIVSEEKIQEESYWADTHKGKIVSNDDLIKKIGRMDKKELEDKGYISIEPMSVRELQKKFVENIKPKELRDGIKAYIQHSDKDFDTALEEIKSSNNGLSEKIGDYFLKETINTAVLWFEKNHLDYNVSVQYQKYLTDRNYYVDENDKFWGLKERLRKKRPLELSDVKRYIEKDYEEEDDKNKVTWWYHLLKKRFSYYKDMEQKFGTYDQGLYGAYGYIPLEQIDIAQLQKEFIENIEPAELRAGAKAYIKKSKEDFKSTFYEVMDRYGADLSEQWERIEERATYGQAIEWLEKNKIAYKVDRTSRQYFIDAEKRKDGEKKVFSVKSAVRRMRKPDVAVAAFYIEKCTGDEWEKDLVTSWYDRKQKEFIPYKDLQKKYGAYDEDVFSREGYLPLEQVNITQFRKEFIETIEPAELRECVRDYMQSTQETFDISFNMMIEEYEKLGELYYQTLMKILYTKAIDWFEKNEIKYRLKRKNKSYLDGVKAEEKDKIFFRWLTWIFSHLKLNAGIVSLYASKCYFDESDKDFVTWWYNPKEKEFIDYRDLAEKYGQYNEENFTKSGLLPMDQINKQELQEEFIKTIEPAEIREAMREYLKGVKEDENLSFMTADKEFGKLWEDYFAKAALQTAVRWLGKNNLAYRVDKAHRKYLKQITSCAEKRNNGGE